MKATLKKRFILFAMFAVTVLLVVLIGTINIISWTVLEKQSDDLLQAIVMRGEKPHFLDNPQMEPPAEDSFPERPGRGPFQPPMNQDTLNSARFFVVITDLEGQVLSMNLDEIASVDKEQAEEYAAKATGESGEIGSFKYEAKTTGEERILFFMDTSGQKQTFLMILSISCLIALMCWGLVLLFVMALSGRVVQPIVAAMEKQKQFITNAGHELKTPLAIIQSNNDASELIYGETKYSTNIRQQTRRLNGLMSNLLTLARLSEQTSLQKEHVNLSSLLEKMAADYELPARDKNLTLHLDVRKDVCMDGQEETFAMLLSILLDNAIKYTPEGGFISIGLQEQNGKIVLSEENTCSESTEDPERFFERFYRGDAARTQSDTSSGYGIGLSAARDIVEMSGGTLKAERPEKDRIRFTAVFPRSS